MSTSRRYASSYLGLCSKGGTEIKLNPPALLVTLRPRDPRVGCVKRSFVRKERGWVRRVGVGGMLCPMGPPGLWGTWCIGLWLAEWLEGAFWLAEERERFRFQQSGWSFFCSSARTWIISMWDMSLSASGYTFAFWEKTSRSSVARLFQASPRRTLIALKVKKEIHYKSF